MLVGVIRILFSLCATLWIHNGWATEEMLSGSRAPASTHSTQDLVFAETEDGRFRVTRWRTPDTTQLPEFKTAYCPTSGKHKLKAGSQTETKLAQTSAQLAPARELLIETVYLPDGTSIPGGGEEGCVLVTENFTKSHELLTPIPHDGKCPTQIEELFTHELHKPVIACKVEKKFSEITFYRLEVEDPNPSENRGSDYLAISTNNLFVLESTSDKFTLGSIFKSSDSSFQYVFIEPNPESRTRDTPLLAVDPLITHHFHKLTHRSPKPLSTAAHVKGVRGEKEFSLLLNTTKDTDLVGSDLWPEEARKQLQELRVAFRQFIDLHRLVDKEAESSKENLARLWVGFEWGHFPESKSFSAADKELNAVYSKLIKDWKASSEKGRSSEDIKKAQRAWIPYRDAWEKLARVRYPSVPSDTFKTWITQMRVQELVRLVKLNESAEEK